MADIPLFVPGMGSYWQLHYLNVQYGFCMHRPYIIFMASSYHSAWTCTSVPLIFRSRYGKLFATSLFKCTVRLLYVSTVYNIYGVNIVP